jgi:hypothetical protein
MRTVLIAVFLVPLLAVDAQANTGILFGSGHTITLGKTEQVQMASEEVTIRPICGWEPILDSVDYRCTFVLKNLTTKPVTIQVGFPLDSQFVQENREKRNARELVLDYHFIARDEKNTYHVRFVPADSQKKFSRVFVWDMAFAGAETKVLHVGYQLSMSQALSSTRKDFATSAGLAKHDKRWHAALETCFVEFFQYVTETGKSWAGPVERATFQVETGRLAECIKRRPLLPFDPPDPKPDREEWEYDAHFPLKAGAFYQHIEPDGGKYDAKTGVTTWEYRPYRPGAPFALEYFMLAIPPTAADCDCWVRQLLGKKPSKTDLAELREIAAAFYGIAPQSASAKKFVEQQIWYHPKSGLQESQLGGEPRAVLKRLDAIAKEKGH